MSSRADPSRASDRGVTRSARSSAGQRGYWSVMTLALITVAVLVAVALLAAGGALDRTRTVVRRRERVVEPAPRRVVVEEHVADRVGERPADRP